MFTHKTCSVSNSSHRCVSFHPNVSLGVGEVARPVKALRDTVFSQSFLLENVLPNSEASLQEVTFSRHWTGCNLCVFTPSAFGNWRVLTHAQQNRLGDVVNLSETFLCWEEPLKNKIFESDSIVSPKDDTSFMAAQKADPFLALFLCFCSGEA